MTERVSPTGDDQPSDLARSGEAIPVPASVELADLARTVATKAGSPDIAVFSRGTMNKQIVRSPLSRIAWGRLVSLRILGPEREGEETQLGLVILAPVGALKVVTGVGRPELL